MRRTKEDAGKTRQAIIDAALEVFNLRGVTSASLIEIAERAGVTRGAIYWHFKDKIDLYFALYKGLLEKYGARPQDYLSRRYDNLDRFIADIQRPLDLFDKNREFRMFMQIAYSQVEYIKELNPIVEDERVHQRAMVDAFARVLTDLQERGYVRNSVDCRQFAFILFSFIDGLYDCWVFDIDFYSGKSSPSVLVEALIEPIRP